MTFGDRLKKARKAKKLTQAEVAKIVGIDFTTISKYENNHSEPDNETLMKLAELYDIRIDKLLGQSKEAKIAQEFVDSLELTDEEIIERFPLTIDGRPLTTAEAKRFIAFVRADRQMR